MRLYPYLQLMRLDKPIGILLLLWPTLWALWLANRGLPPLGLLLVFVLGVILTRSAGCVINDIADYEFDAQIKRTQLRPLAAGVLSLNQAWALFVVLGLLAASLLLWVNTLTRWLALPAVVLLISYPFFKRITHLPQLILGLAYSWGVPMAFAATLGYVPWHAWLWFAIACLWPIAYDTFYAMADRPEDVNAGVKSLAILLGPRDLTVIAVLHSVMILLFIAAGLWYPLHWPYYVGVGAAVAMMSYLHYLAKDRTRARCFKAFRLSHWVGFLIWVGIVSAV
ncbi:MAG: 4-hydroxybenzoate octaprenyltransferase [Gammaproteobacteria bacterium]